MTAPIAPPANVTPIKVTAQYTDFMGYPQQGTVTITPSDVGRDAGGAGANRIFIAQDIVCTLDANGNLKGPDGNLWVNLLPTDDPDLLPAQLTYSIEEVFDSGWTRQWVFSLSTTLGAAVDLATIDPDAALVDNEEGVTT